MLVPQSEFSPKVYCDRRQSAGIVCFRPPREVSRGRLGLISEIIACPNRNLGRNPIIPKKVRRGRERCEEFQNCAAGWGSNTASGVEQERRAAANSGGSGLAKQIREEHFAVAARCLLWLHPQCNRGSGDRSQAHGASRGEGSEFSPKAPAGAAEP